MAGSLFGFGAPSLAGPAAVPALGALPPLDVSRLLQSLSGGAGPAPMPGPSIADGAGFGARFDQSPPGQGFGVAPQAVAPMRTGLLRQAPGEIVPPPSGIGSGRPGSLEATGSADVSTRAGTPGASITSRPPADDAKPVFGFGQPAADQPAGGALPIMGRLPLDMGEPASPGAAAPAQGGFGAGLKRFFDNDGGDLLGALGIGFLTNRGFGPGLAAGAQLAQAQEARRAATGLARAEHGLRVSKLAREQQAENQTARLIAGKLGIPLDQATALAGNSGFVGEFFRNGYTAPAGYQRNVDGSLAFTPGGEKDPATIRAHAEAQAAGAAAGKPDEPFNLSPGQTRFDPSGTPLVSLPDRMKGVEQASGLRKEIHQLPSYKNYTQALPVYQGMLETADRDSKASDLNLIYGLGKIMDPGSVVREGELRLAQDTQGVADRLIGMYNGVMGGARLSPQARQQLLSEAFGRIQSYEQAFGQDRRGYEGIVARHGMNVDDVLPNFLPARPYQAPQRAQPGTAPDGAVRALRSDPALREQFNAKYGRGAADRYLGGR